MAQGIFSPAQLTRNYSYLTSPSGNATTLVSGLSYSGKANTSFSYTYDSRGNITAVYRNGSLETSYEYDDLSQLIHENNTQRYETYVYTYDNAGNILIKKTYALTAAGTTPTSPQSTKTYTYGNAN